MRYHRIIRGSLSVGVVWALVLSVGACTKPDEQNKAKQAPATQSQEAAEVYTCPMHPNIRQDHPGTCPICHMDLIPVEQGKSQESDLSIQPSKRAVALMNIQTTTVTRSRSSSKLEVTGRLVVNEGTTSRITAWAPGRVDRLYIDTVGEKVAFGQPVVAVHSHEIAVAAGDLTRANHIMDEAEEGGLRYRTAFQTAKAVRMRLRQMGLSQRQIQQIAEGQGSTERVIIYAPSAGTVLSRNASEGEWLQRGEIILSIADLDTIWAELEVYQEDLGRVSKGDQVKVKVAGQEKVVTGTIDMVEPVVNERRRVGIARVELDNSEGGFRPQTLVNATITLEDAEKKNTDSSVVTVPNSALLWTGERSIVYVKDASAQPPVYMPIDVKTGQRFEESTEILSGVFPGEEVVTHGAFRLDASLQIQGGQSMMSPSESTGESTHMKHDSHGSPDPGSPAPGSPDADGGGHEH